MADQTSAAHLYASLTQLAYAVTQMAISPKPPFSTADQANLASEGTNTANCAAAFRQKNPGPISQPALFAAQQKVNAALAMLNLINSAGSSSLSKSTVLNAVTTAIAAVNAL